MLVEVPKLNLLVRFIRIELTVSLCDCLVIPKPCCQIASNRSRGASSNQGIRSAFFFFLVLVELCLGSSEVVQKANSKTTAE